MAELECCQPIFWLYIALVIVLVLISGLMSGLTLGLMSLGIMDLEVLIESGSPKDQKHASRILPVVKNQHLLLCTLLVGNSIAMEALPIFLDALIAPWGAIIVSVTLILLFGEIIPQAICTRYGLAVGSTMAPFVRLLLILFFPITYPISKLLDFLLGAGHGGSLFRRAELKALVHMHGNEAGKGGELTHDETTIIAGALELTGKVARDAMTPIASTFSIDVNAKLDVETMDQLISKGHSRVPVYHMNPRNIIGVILVKSLIAAHPNENVTLRDHATIRKIPRVDESMPLYDILNEFQKGHSHMAAVVRRSRDSDSGTKKPVAMARLDRRLGSSNHRKVVSRVELMKSKSMPAALEHSLDADGIILVKVSACANSLKYERRNMDDGPTVGSPRGNRRKRASDDDFLRLQEDPIPSFPEDEEVVGIITMEDVIEELLQEEILDETDEYIDVHSTIKVNLLPVDETIKNLMVV